MVKPRPLVVTHVLILVFALALAFAPRPSAHAQEPAPRSVDDVIASLSVDERVGQLIMVNFVNDDVSAGSQIAELVQEFRVGAVYVTTSNGNIVNEGNTPAALVRLTNGLQTRAYEASRRGEADDEYFLPLFIATDNEGDGFPFTNATNGYTPLPNNMTIGATFSKTHAQAAGVVVGRELSAAGINLLLGPVVDVLGQPRSGGDGDIGIRSFGGNAAWVGALGRAYVRGVHEGSAGRMLTVAKHFPGHGGSDRSTDSEVPTVNKSLTQLRAVELAPFAELARVDATDAAGVSDAMMVSHIRYRNFQPGETEPLTDPISLDGQAFRTLMELPEFASWRPNHMVMADALGVQALKDWYRDHEGQPTFPNRTVVREALMAGNDLLPLIEFYIDDAETAWADFQVPVIKDTILYFREQYVQDPDFRRRADQALRHVLSAKLALYPSLSLDGVLSAEAAATQAAGSGEAEMRALAEAALTLVQPGTVTELRARLPRGPQPPDRVLIVECWTDCYPFPLRPPDELQERLLALYGGAGAGRIRDGDVATISFSDLDAWLEAPADPANASIADAINSATWMIFALADYNPSQVPASGAVKRFLDRAPADTRNKNLVAMAYSAPYHLDGTEISKLTAYFAMFSKNDFAIDASFRALFGDLVPRGHSPVDIDGIFYDVDDATLPDDAQEIPLSVYGHDAEDVPAGDAIGLVAGPIVDRNGNPVPDGTDVQFTLRREDGSSRSANGRTSDGLAGAELALAGGGTYEATASVRNIVSPPLEMNVDAGAPPVATPDQGDAGPIIDPPGSGGVGAVTLALIVGVPTTAALALAAGGALLIRARRRRSQGPVTATRAPVDGPRAPVAAAAAAVPQATATLRIDAETRRVYIKGAEVRPGLSNEQFRLLLYLYERAGKVVARDELVRHVWPDAHAEGVSEEALDALVRRVRERILNGGGERSYVVTLRGQGFRLEIDGK